MSEPLRGAGSGKSGGGSGHEADDNLVSTAYIEVLEVVSEGPVKGVVNGGKNIFMNDSPILDAEGNLSHRVTWETRAGWQGQDPFKSVTSVSSEDTVNTKVLHGTPAVASISNVDANFAVATLTVPRLMQGDDKGNVNGSFIEFNIECQPSEGGWVPVARPSSLSAGAQIGGVFASPAASYLADVYVTTAFPLSVDILHSIDGVNYTVAETVQTQWTFVAGLGFAAQASTRLALGEGVHWLQWFGSSATGNIVWWTSYGSGLFIVGKTMSQYQKQYRFALPGTGPWQVRVSRITPDTTSVKLANDLYFSSLRTEIVANLSYPNSAMILYRIPAEEFSTVPSRRALWDLLVVSVPSNYNPDTRDYDGIWDGTFKQAWTDNPAWCFYDLCRKTRYGLGRFIAALGIDKWALYQIGQYCDGLVDSGARDGGGSVIYEPRFRLNVHINSMREAFAVLGDMASVFRGMLYVLDGALTAVCDQPSDPVAMFNQANVINGEFKFSGTAALAKKTVALVEWMDPDDLYNRKVEYVSNRAGILRFGINETRVTAFGCTSRGQAHRLGKWLLIDGEVVSFGVGLDAAHVKPGEIVQCMIPLRSGNQRLGGRLAAVDGTSVTLDAPVALTLGHAYELSAILPDGSIASRAVEVSESATTDTLTIASPFPDAPVPNAIWTLVDLDGIQPTLWRVIGIAPGDGLTTTITAISHDPGKYEAIDNFDAAIDDSVFPVGNPLSILPPGEVTIENLPFNDKNGMAQNKLHLHWLQSSGAARYQVSWRLNDGNWHRSPQISGTLWELIVKDDGDYDFQVVAISILGKFSSPAKASATIDGDATLVNLDAQWDE